MQIADPSGADHLPNRDWVAQFSTVVDTAEAGETRPELHTLS